MFLLDILKTVAYFLADRCGLLRTVTLTFSILPGVLAVAILPGDFLFKKEPLWKF
jgi:hypothetical protein